MLITLICHILLTQQCLPWFITILVFASCGTMVRHEGFTDILIILAYYRHCFHRSISLLRWLKIKQFSIASIVAFNGFYYEFLLVYQFIFNSRKLKLIPLDKILIWCGINSLALLGLHILFVDTFWIVRNKLHLVNYSWTILEFALIVAICYFATTLIKRYIPSVLGRS